jgi:excinuclease ABC subunit A
MDNKKREKIVFSARYACPVCGYSLSELEPRLFSFNNPAGACPTCDGLGVQQFFDPERVVVHPEVGLNAGAIRGWDRRNIYYYQLLTSLARHYGFDMDVPFMALPQAIQDLILYGSGEVAIEFSYFNDRGGEYRKLQPFEGVIPNMQRRYRDTESNVVREELARYLSHQPCPDCRGTRLNQGARNVYILDKTLPAVTAMPIDIAQAFFAELSLPTRGNRHKNRHGNQSTTRFSGQRRTRVPEPGSQRGHALRRRGATYSSGKPDWRGTGWSHVYSG